MQAITHVYEIQAQSHLVTEFLRDMVIGSYNVYPQEREIVTHHSPFVQRTLNQGWVEHTVYSRHHWKEDRNSYYETLTYDVEQTEF